jgi:hypothetical protein
MGSCVASAAVDALLENDYRRKSSKKEAKAIGMMQSPQAG